MQRSQSAKPSNGGEAGQALVMAVGFMTLAVIIAAFTINVGLFLRERSHLQNAADAAALAGAAELPGLPDAALLYAEEWAAANGIDPADPDYTFDAVTPYNGDAGKIEVEVSHRIGVFFPALFSPLQDVSARAVAYAQDITSGGAYAIFVINNDCATPDPFQFSGSTSDVTGLVHSNSDAKVNGSDNSFFDGPLSYSCAFDNTGQNNTYIPGTAQVPNRVPPVDYTFSDFPCTVTYTADTDLGSQPEVWVDEDPLTLQLKSGVYCSTQDLILSGQGISGNVTLVAGDELKLAGSDFFDLNGYWNNVLAFSSASHDAAIDISGSGGDWIGLINAPNGRVKFQGSNDLSLTGSIVADRVTISGQDFSLNAQDLGGPSASSIALVE